MNPKLTDDAVAGLPLSHGRADLLEEIMSTPVLDDLPVRTEGPRRRTTWVVPAAAAAMVAILALGTAWWASGTDPVADRSGGFASQPIAGNADEHVVLGTPGWVVTSAYADKDTGEMTYEKGGQSFDVMWGPADTYEDYVEDRRHIVEPAADGAPIEVLGSAAQMWAYSDDDHTAIRAVENGQWIEFRGTGMREPGYLALLDSLQVVDLAGFEATLPGSFVLDHERDAAIAAILDDIDAMADPLLPNGVERSSITSTQTDDYQLGAEIAGAVTCSWLNEFADAKRAGAEDRAQRAAAVLATSYDWPVLHQMSERGEYPDVIWDYADQVAAGEIPEGYQGGLGC